MKAKVLSLFCTLATIGCQKQKDDIGSYEFYMLEVTPSFNSSFLIKISKNSWEKHYTGIVDTNVLEMDSGVTNDFYAMLKTNKINTTSFDVDTVALKRIDEIINKSDFKKLAMNDSVLGLDGAGWQIGYGKKGYSQYFSWWSPNSETMERKSIPVLKYSKEMIKMTGPILRNHAYYNEVVVDTK
jgi:hypothetical protein